MEIGWNAEEREGSCATRSLTSAPADAPSLQWTSERWSRRTRAGIVQNRPRAWAWTSPRRGHL